jgi:hypothetical protein
MNSEQAHQYFTKDPFFSNIENMEKLAKQLFTDVETLEMYKEDYVVLNDEICDFYNNNDSDDKKNAFLDKTPEEKKSRNELLKLDRFYSFKVEREFCVKCLYFLYNIKKTRGLWYGPRQHHHNNRLPVCNH